MKRKILIIAFFFPPSGVIGAVRITKFVKYLLRFGWDVTVLTVKEKYYDNLNYDWLKDVEGANIIRTDIIKPIKGLKEWGLYWLPYLKKELDKVLSNEKFDISLWTGNPFYNWVLAPYAKKKYALKYVLDFRDGWRLEKKIRSWKGGKFYKLKRAIDHKISEYVEPIIVRNADGVINVTEEMTNLFRSTYPEFDSSNVLTIYNGYDKEDCACETMQKEHDFEIVYAGKFGNFLNPKNFFWGLQEYYNHINAKFSIKFIWIGEKDDYTQSLINKKEIRNLILFLGFKPYKEVLSYIKRADLCLLLVSHPTEGSTKIFDYMALDKPILVISKFPEGRVFEILKNYEKAYFVEDDHEKIFVFLKDFFERKEEINKIIANKESLEFYNREFQTKQLEYMLNKIIECETENEERN